MPAPRNTILIEGTFRELSEEFADYVDNLRKAQGDTTATLQTSLTPVLEKFPGPEEAQDTDEVDSLKDDVLKQLVPASAILNTAPEKEFIAAYNLLVHLIHQSLNVNKYLQPICRNLSNEITSSPANRFGLALSILSTIFNVLDPDDSIRFNVFLAILDVIKRSSNFETIKPQLKHIDTWLLQWQAESTQQRKLFLTIAQTAKSAGDDAEAYEYLIRALRTIDNSDVSGEEAQTLSIEALRTALQSPTHFDFEDLTSLDSVQALRSSDPEFYQLLEIFTADQLEDYNDFKDEHPGWIEQQGLDEAALERKMRLLTLASLAASTGQTRSLPYVRIVSALKIPSKDVEMWVIDVIRAGLVEGKLSQLNQTFLIHRSTYRVFGENQWREVASRLDMWRTSLISVLGVIRQEKENYLQQKEQEARTLESRVNGTGGGQSYKRFNRDAIEVGMD